MQIMQMDRWQQSITPNPWMSTAVSNQIGTDQRHDSLALFLGEQLPVAETE